MASQRKRSEVIRVHNRGTQMIPLQVRPPGGDFYLHEQQVYVGPGKSVMLPKSHLMMDQVNNLTARGMLRITYDSESAGA